MFGQKPKKPRFPEGRVGYAIGDIHGRADLLVRMFDRLESEARPPNGRAPIVIFMGDYVDRGPDSAEVVELLQTGRPEGFERRFLKGNHEAALWNFVRDPVTYRAWLNHGGLETLASYKVSPLPSLGASAEDVRAAGRAFATALPQSHRAFFDGLERFALLGDYLFVHAGVDPAKSLENQTDADLMWIRRRFLADHRRYEHHVVHGHTPTDAPYADERRVGIDTGAYFSGQLSAARFEGEALSFITVR